MSFENLSVLAIDDIPLNLLLIRKMLARLDGLKVKTVDNGIEALSMIEEEKPSLVLVDIMMPEMDGYEVIRRIRANPATANLHIVVLSALNSNADIVKGLNLGANDYITKPMILEKLLTCVITQLQLVEAGK